MRIAPDRQEQHSFKERMSSLGELCLINLTQPETAMGKVRANKNYAPGRGENNRYIIYSDAIQALPSGMVYEVVSEEKQHTSLTRQYYLRSGGRISGPHCPDGSVPCPASQSLMPDCERLFYVEMPDGTSRMFYWPHDREEESEAEAAVAAPAADEAPVEEAPESPPALEVLQKASLFEEAAQQVRAALDAAGFAVEGVQAGRLLLLCLLFDQVQLYADNLADAGLAARTVAALFPAGSVQAGEAGEGDSRATLHLLAGSGQMGKKLRKRYLTAPWPVCVLESAAGFPRLTDLPPVSLNLRALRGEVQSCPVEADQEVLHQLLAQIQQEDQPLPLYVKGQLARFVCADFSLHGQEREGLEAFLHQAFAQPYYRALGLDDTELKDQWV